MKQHDITLLHLSLIHGIGAATIGKIIQGCGVSTSEGCLRGLSDLYSYVADDFFGRCLLDRTASKRVVEGLTDKSILDRELQLLERHSIDCITLLDERYPELLRHIYLPPPVLYCKGACLEKYTKRMAIVGSRNANNYALSVIGQLIPPLLQNGWQIVSGGAIGADSMAHSITLQAGGSTLVVFGSGLLHPYPKSNRDLFHDIINNNGTLLSCFPLDTYPEKWLFPARNRIISGVSQGCIVVQAARKSGALITAEFALEQGRHLFAVPGAVDDPLSSGCHILIKQGACLVESVYDIAQDLGEEMSVLQDSCVQSFCFASSKDKNACCQVSCPSHKAHGEPNELESKVLSLLCQPLHLDQLLCQTGLSLAQLNAVLFALELQGKITQRTVGMWQVLR